MTNDMGEVVRDTIGVDNYDKFAYKIEGEGGQMISEKIKIPNMGYMGSFKDTEGNIFVIIEPNLEEPNQK